MEKCYSESLFYQIRLSAKYVKLLGEQLFEGLKIETSLDEFIALDIINNNKNLCQRDLAKMLLKDRANTGRIIAKLEERGFISVNIDKKSNRLVKLLSLTKKGEKFTEATTKRIRPYMEYIAKGFEEEYIEKFTNTLIDFRKKLSELVETQI